MYGVHTATTLVPILAEFAYGGGRSNPKKGALIAIYATYAIIPLLLALQMACCRVPFPAEKKKKAA